MTGDSRTKKCRQKHAKESPHRLLRCYWPQLFTKRRPLNRYSRQAENQPYIDYVQTKKFDGEEDEGDISGEDEEEEEEDDDDVLSEDEDEIKGNRGKRENKDENRNDDKDAAVCNRQSIVRLFMVGMTGDEETLQYPDQVEQVVSFYEQGNFGESETKTGQGRKVVALLDDRNICGTLHVNQELFQCTGHCRPHLGPLTSEELCEELERKVTHISCSRQSSRETHIIHSVSESSRTKMSPLTSNMWGVTRRGD